MKKSLLETFIQKYALGGAINSVNLDSTDGVLSVSGTTQDMQAMAFVKSDKLRMNFELFLIKKNYKHD